MSKYAIRVQKMEKIKKLFFTLKNPEIPYKGICYIDML